MLNSKITLGVNISAKIGRKLSLRSVILSKVKLSLGKTLEDEA
jgi:hypothetical protein